jgi:hypothetical protein
MTDVGRSVVQPADAVSRIALGDFAYGSVPNDPDDTPHIIDAEIDRQAGIPDRRHTPQGLEIPPPDTVLHVSEGSDSDEGGGRGPGTLAVTIGGRTGGLSLSEVLTAARQCRLVDLDSPSFRSPLLLAQLALGLSAGGACSRLEPGVIDGLIHPELLRSLIQTPTDPFSDAVEWGAHSALIRHLAWRHHDLTPDLAADQWRLRPRALPAVSVLMATCRPKHIGAAIKRMADQDYGNIEVIVALHGIGQEKPRVLELLAEHQLQGLAVAVDGKVPFGHALNLALAKASGELVSKWDDDDLYGARHLGDLALAMRYSNAELVGKAAEFVHYRDENRTVLRDHEGQEQFSRTIAGGTMTLHRSTLVDVGGFAPVARSVDRYLLKALHREGGRSYRTHGFGFVLVRHSDGHTWNPPQGQLDKRVERTWQGLPPVAGVTNSE